MAFGYFDKLKRKFIRTAPSFETLDTGATPDEKNRLLSKIPAVGTVHVTPVPGQRYERTTGSYTREITPPSCIQRYAGQQTAGGSAVQSTMRLVGTGAWEDSALTTRSSTDVSGESSGQKTTKRPSGQGLLFDTESGAVEDNNVKTTRGYSKQVTLLERRRIRQKTQPVVSTTDRHTASKTKYPVNQRQKTTPESHTRRPPPIKRPPFEQQHRGVGWTLKEVLRAIFPVWKYCAKAADGAVIVSLQSIFSDNSQLQPDFSDFVKFQHTLESDLESFGVPSKSVYTSSTPAVVFSALEMTIGASVLKGLADLRGVVTTPVLNTPCQYSRLTAITQRVPTGAVTPVQTITANSGHNINTQNRKSGERGIDHGFDDLLVSLIRQGEEKFNARFFTPGTTFKRGSTCCALYKPNAYCCSRFPAIELNLGFKQQKTTPDELIIVV